jgi:hypothetical protein
LRKNDPQPVVNVQTGETRWSGVYVNPGCPPELPAEYRFSHRVVQKRSGEWCFLPLIYDTVPESWCWTREDRKALLDSEWREDAQEISGPMNHSEPAPAYRETQSCPAEETQEITESQENQETEEREDTGFSDHQITRSPDHPIPEDHPISSSDPELSPEEIMNDLEETIEDYLVCSPHQRTVLALWILHTYCHNASATTPYLNIYSPVEQSGKSTCLGLLRAFCNQSWFASGVPASTLTRKIIADRPTVLLDNWHTTFRASDKNHITGFLLNSCELFQPFTHWDKGTFRPVQVYCPKAFAGLSSLPPTLAQRSIPIVLHRRLPHQQVAPVFRLVHPKETRDFTSWAEQWATATLKTIDYNTANPEHRKSLAALSPHQQACGQTLLGIAETLGGEWPEKARIALLEIFHEEQAREASATQLLSDVYDAFASHNHTQRIFTNELLEYLHSLDHRQWYEWNKGKPMTAHTLSILLRKHFNIYSRSQRRDKQKRRGYQQSDFTDAWQRYLPGHHTGNTTETAIGDETAGQPSISSKAGSRSQDHPITGSPDNAKPPTSDPRPSQSAFRSGKSSLVSMSQFKARWTKSTSALRQFASKAIGLFAATRT